MSNLQQHPPTGNRILANKGDLLEFTLTLPAVVKGCAFLRNNMTAARPESGKAVDSDLIRQYEHWYDIPMLPAGESTYRLMLPLSKVGYFAAKAGFLPADSDTPIWPDGENTVIKVEPADYCSANVVYNAFVRQIGGGKYHNSTTNPVLDDYCRTLDDERYTVVPPSGTFRDLIKELDHIMVDMGCRILLLLPIFPTPTVYGRMGRFGSAFASLDFLDVDPALAEFDLKSTPFDQFKELVDEIHARDGKVFLDLAINHTGWGSKLQEDHPDWFVRNADGSFYSPRAWGNIWADLVKLDYSHRELWDYMVGVFRLWCRHEVDGFRCDAGYKVPVDAWEYIVKNVREQFPDTIFLLEGLGGRLSTTRSLLSDANLNWAYSELFQNYNRDQIENYLPLCTHVSASEGLMVHFAETHDNNRLAARSHAYSRLRTALAALTSHQGAYGFANGVEWYAADKIDVHDARSLNWGNPINQVAFIAKINRLIRFHPAFQKGTSILLIQKGPGNAIACHRRNQKFDSELLVLLNLDDDRSNDVYWSPNTKALATPHVVDLLSGNQLDINGDGDTRSFSLEPGAVYCLSSDANRQIDDSMADSGISTLDFNTRQCFRAKVMEIRCGLCGSEDFEEERVLKLAKKLYDNPVEFCSSILPADRSRNVISWKWPEDLAREVMIPPDFFVVIHINHRFRVRLQTEKHIYLSENSLPQADGSNFVLIPPISIPNQHLPVSLDLKVFMPNEIRVGRGNLLYLCRFHNTKVKNVFTRIDIDREKLAVLQTNRHNTVVVANARWGHLYSRYDALLAGNLNPRCPDDRRIMLSRCRMWIVSEGFSHEISDEFLVALAVLNNSSAVWTFDIPTGNAETIRIEIRQEVLTDRNGMRLDIGCGAKYRPKAGDGRKRPIFVVVRPDINDRSFHELTKAYTGPQHHWPGAVSSNKQGFSFARQGGHTLAMRISAGSFTIEPEWSYSVHFREDAERGQDADSDLFSPGYFKFELGDKELVSIQSVILTDWDREFLVETGEAGSGPPKIPDDTVSSDSIENALKRSIGQYIVNRDHLSTIIAGYPWFLDWGRDTLICLRGVIAAGLIDIAKDILSQFGTYEDRGTMPNTIRGDWVANRDTSDASLWFIVACSDLSGVIGTKELSQIRCGDRTIVDVIESVVDHYSSRTPNGIYMDSESGLIFSPSHYTWMDTNYPAGTPRQGYPIEIQSLWYAALDFAAGLTGKKNWKHLAKKVRNSIIRYYRKQNQCFLADCLHANAGESASSAIADDALRPNQLLAITLGAIDEGAVGEMILTACQSLLVPGGIRSLADAPVDYPIPVRGDAGNLLNDPVKPYWGNYRGEEDTRRKPAYHNGTAWTWLFPSFSEAWIRIYGNSDEQRDVALAILGSSEKLLNEGCARQIPEILDGNFPHRQRGCMAQAWGVTELYRVIRKLTGNTRSIEN